jgi:hypothetical protein
MSRFSPGVEAALLAAGWYPGRQIGADTLAAIHREIAVHQSRYGGTLRTSPAADRALAEFGGLALGGDRPGELNTRPFALDPTLARYAVATLIDAGRALGTPLYPLGVEGMDDAVLAINPLGQVFALDATGDWFLGDDPDAALETLVTGRLPALVGDDGRWPGRVWESGTGPIGGHKRPVGAAFFLPRTAANLYDVWLPDTLTRIGTVPHADPEDPGRLAVEWGDLDCEAHVLDLDGYTVLVLAFDLNQYLDQRAEAEKLGEERSGPDATALARTFRTACVALGEDLDVAFVQTRPTDNLLRHVADREFDVLTADAPGLVAQGLPLLYLSAGYAEGIGTDPARDELPVPDGRLIFAGTGAHRW